MNGMHYVALSRVTGLKGLFIINLNKNKLGVDKEVAREMERLRTSAKMMLCYTPVYHIPKEKCKILFQNAQSFHGHYNDLVCDPNFLAADMICLAESRLNDRDQDQMYHIPEFQGIIRNDQNHSRSNQTPHGLAMFVRNNHSLLSAQHFSTNSFECSILKVKFNQKEKCCSVIVLYKAPNTCCKEQFLNHMSNLSTELEQGEEYIVVGDFNYDIQKPEGQTVIKSVQRLLPSFPRQLVTEPSTEENTTIDLAFSNIENATAGTITVVWSYHKTIVLSY